MVLIMRITGGLPFSVTPGMNMSKSTKDAAHLLPGLRRISELRAVELLENLCKGMHKYTLVVVNTTADGGKKVGMEGCLHGCLQLLALLNMHPCQVFCPDTRDKYCLIALEDAFKQRPSLGVICEVQITYNGIGNSRLLHASSRNYFLTLSQVVNTFDGLSYGQARCSTF